MDVVRQSHSNLHRVGCKAVQTKAISRPSDIPHIKHTGRAFLSLPTKPPSQIIPWSGIITYRVCLLLRDPGIKGPSKGSNDLVHVKGMAKGGIYLEGGFMLSNKIGFEVTNVLYKPILLSGRSVGIGSRMQKHGFGQQFDGHDALPVAVPPAALSGHHVRGCVVFGQIHPDPLGEQREREKLKFKVICMLFCFDIPCL